MLEGNAKTEAGELAQNIHNLVARVIEAGRALDRLGDMLPHNGPYVSGDESDQYRRAEAALAMA
jgi:hypothetical protein